MTEPLDRHPAGTGAELPTSLSKEQLALVVSLASDAIIALDANERILFFNDGAAATFGYTAAEILGRPLSLLIPERYRTVHHQHVQSFGESAEDARPMGHRRQIFGLRRDGSEFPAEATIAKAGRGSERYYLVVLRDATDRQRAANELLEQQRLLREAQSIAHVGSWQWEIESNVVAWSDELFRIYGLEPGTLDLSLQTFLDRVLPEDRDNTRSQLQRALETGEPFDFEERIRRPDGSVRVLRSRGTVDRDGAGEARRLLGVCQDITDQKAADEAAIRLAGETAARAAAEAAEARMKLLAAASQELSSSLDYAETLRTVARLAVPDIADWAAVDVLENGVLRRVAAEHVDPAKVQLAQRLHEQYPPDPDAAYGAWNVIRTGRSEFMHEIPDALLEDAARDAEHLGIIRSLGLASYIAVPLVARDTVLGAFVLVHAESGRRYTEADVALVEDLGRRAATAIENARLVTQLRDAQERLQEQALELEQQTEAMEHQNQDLQAQARELQRVSGAKSDFMATVSHELRTPLNAIIGYTELLRDGVPAEIPEASRQQVERIQLGARHLLQLIEEILTFSSLEAGRQQVHLQDVDVPALLSELDAIVRPLAEHALLEFTLVASSAPSVLRSDPVKLRQILLNLLSNAVKFTESGSIMLEVQSDGAMVEFVVRDTGIGVTAADQEQIFEPFWQADQTLTRRVQGAGLGLAIAHRFTHLLGGTIQVTSRPAAGSEFTVRLPLDAAAVTEFAREG
jgi:PAS domain S-box-containing protein